MHMENNFALDSGKCGVELQCEQCGHTYGCWGLSRAGIFSTLPPAVKDLVLYKNPVCSAVALGASLAVYGLLFCNLHIPLVRACGCVFSLLYVCVCVSFRYCKFSPVRACGCVCSLLCGCAGACV